MDIKDLDLDLDLVNGVGCLGVQAADFGRRRLGLDIVNGVGCLGVQGGGLALGQQPMLAQAAAGAAFGGGRSHHRWSVCSFCML